MWMNIGHLRWLGTFEQNDRPMGTSRQNCRLGKEPAIRERRREIGVRLSFHDHAFVDAVVAYREACHLHVEVTRCSREIQQCGLPLRKVDAQLVSRRPTLPGFPASGRTSGFELSMRNTSKWIICGRESQRSTVGGHCHRAGPRVLRGASSAPCKPCQPYVNRDLRIHPSPSFSTPIALDDDPATGPRLSRTTSRDDDAIVVERVSTGGEVRREVRRSVPASQLASSSGPPYPWGRGRLHDQITEAVADNCSPCIRGRMTTR